MVCSHTHEVFGTHFFIQSHQFLRVPAFSFPEWNDVLVAVGGRVPVVGEMMLIMAVARLVHAPGVPVAVHLVAEAEEHRLAEVAHGRGTRPDDRVLVITSAGCNALDYALSGASVLAVDVKILHDVMQSVMKISIGT